jgi:hypothetical protein
MSGRTPDWVARPFGPSELDGVEGLSPDDLAADAFVARELEALAGATGGGLSGDFVDRVMAAVVVEPSPAPARLAGRALRRGALGAFLAAVADAWRVTTGPGFPRAARAQAMALVLLVAGLVAGSGLAMAGALGMFQGERNGPSPHPSFVAPSQPAVAPPVEASFSPEPSEPPDSVAPVATPEEATEPTDAGGAQPTKSPSPHKTASPAATEDHHGGGSGHQATPAPTRTPRPTSTDDDHSGPGGGGGGGDGGDDDHATPGPTETPTPSPTDSGSGSGSGSGDG